MSTLLFLIWSESSIMGHGCISLELQHTLMVFSFSIFLGVLHHNLRCCNMISALLFLIWSVMGHGCISLKLQHTPVVFFSLYFLRGSCITISGVAICPTRLFPVTGAITAASEHRVATHPAVLFLFLGGSCISDVATCSRPFFSNLVCCGSHHGCIIVSSFNIPCQFESPLFSASFHLLFYNPSFTFLEISCFYYLFPIYLLCSDATTAMYSTLRRKPTYAAPRTQVIASSTPQVATHHAGTFQLDCCITVWSVSSKGHVIS